MKFVSAADPHSRSHRAAGARSALAELRDPHPNRRHANVPRQRNVVEACDGDVVRESRRPAARKRLNRADRHIVVRREDRIELARPCRSAPRSPPRRTASSKSPCTISLRRRALRRPSGTPRARSSASMFVARSGNVHDPRSCRSRPDDRRPPKHRRDCRDGSPDAARVAARVLIRIDGSARRQRHGQLVGSEMRRHDDQPVDAAAHCMQGSPACSLPA